MKKYKDNDYRPRFVFEITEEQQLRANRLLKRHGDRRNVFSPILDDVLDMIEEHGDIIVGILSTNRAKPRDIVPSIKKAEKGAKAIRGNNYGNHR